MKMRMNQAIVKAFADEMRSDPSVMLMGEDIAAAGGPFKTSEGLLDEFGPMRVRDTPISEMGFTGAAVGASALGLRPVVEIMFMEFLGVALDQLVTEAAKFRYLSAGQVSCPLVIRASVGSGLGFGSQHSQTLENWVSSTPGLKVVTVSGPQSAYDLMRSAIQDPDPVIVLEPRVLYGERGEVETGDSRVKPLGQAHVIQAGNDVTIVAMGQTVRTSIEAVAQAGIDVEVIDLGTLVPWDRATVFESVKRTGRLVVIEEAPESGGWGGGIVAAVASELFTSLKAPPIRITTPNVPVPYGRSLEAKFLPSVDATAAILREFLETNTAPAPWWISEGFVK
jgi:pyruvate dehydrogenase E1 component beta subunit